MSVQPQLEKFSSLSRVLESSAKDSAAWHEDLERGGLGAAISKIESALSDSPNCPATRLWWVRCQLEAERLPPAALATPLDEIFQELKNKPQLELLTASTLYKLSLLLLGRGQSRLGLLMLERAVEVAEGSETVSDTEVIALRENLISSLKDEQQRALSSRENKKYLESLEENIKIQEQAKKKRSSKRKTAKDIQPNAPSPTLLNGKTIVTSVLESEREQGREKVLSSNEQGTPSSLAEPSSAAANHFENDRTSKKNSSSKVGTLFLLIFLGTAVAAVYWKRNAIFKPVPTPSALAIRLPRPEASELSPPSLKRLVGKPNSLDALGRRLEELSKREEAQRESELKADSKTSTVEIMELPKPQEEELISINEELSSPKQPFTDKSNIPELSAGRFRNTTVESIGTSPMKAPIPNSSPPQLRKDPSGRTYGLPKDNPATAIPSGSRALDGSPLRPYEVKQFDPPMRYRTITSTEVLAAPSLLARSLARLEPKTPVDVKARMGLWLELRSTGGNVGYIYAQDAVPE